MWKRETLSNHLPTIEPKGNHPHPIIPSATKQQSKQHCVMEKKEVKRMRVWYMYFYRNGKRERSPEYPGLTKFVEACGKWCDNHPDDYQLCSRIVTTVE